MPELQKHQLLVKLLKMTTSANDAEALVAMRKANEVLTTAGWDWDRLMAGKITVVGDPFAGLGDPTPKVERQAPQTTGRPASQSDPWQPAWKPMSLPVNAQRGNKFEGFCYSCGKAVASNGGFIFKASDYHSRAPSAGWQVICATCNSSRFITIGPQPAKRNGVGARKATIDDLM